MPVAVKTYIPLVGDSASIMAIKLFQIAKEAWSWCQILVHARFQYASTTPRLSFWYNLAALATIMLRCRRALRCQRFSKSLLLRYHYDNALVAMPLRPCHDLGDGATLSLRFSFLFI